MFLHKFGLIRGCQEMVFFCFFVLQRNGHFKPVVLKCSCPWITWKLSEIQIIVLMHRNLQPVAVGQVPGFCNCMRPKGQTLILPSNHWSTGPQKPSASYPPLQLLSFQKSGDCEHLTQGLRAKRKTNTKVY